MHVTQIIRLITLLLDCGGAGLLFMEFTVCPKICRSDLGILLIREDFRDFGDLGLSLVLSSILVILGILQK